VSPSHVRSSHVSQRTAPSAPKQSRISPRLRHTFGDISPGPPPAPVRGVLDARRFWLSPSLRRRSTTVRAFGTEGQHRSDGLLLHNKTYITRVVLAFPLSQHCKNSPVWPKLCVSRNRQLGRTTSEGHFPKQRARGAAGPRTPGAGRVPFPFPDGMPPRRSTTRGPGTGKRK
jgi:hypothetical protein